jgi:nucleoid-associated protein YgaU
MAERFADGLADVKELYTARGPTIPAEREIGPAARAAYYAANARPVDTVWHVHTAAAEAETRAATRAVTRDWDAAWNAAYSAALRAQADLLREIVGNPYRPIAADPAWLTWSGGTLRRIAQHIYDDRRFAELPVLADALEDAGCDNAELLSHCRSGAEHVRGCWAVDVLLGRA